MIINKLYNKSIYQQIFSIKTRDNFLRTTSNSYIPKWIQIDGRKYHTQFGKKVVQTIWIIIFIS